MERIMKKKSLILFLLVLALVSCQFTIPLANAEDVESRYCLYSDLPGWLGTGTGVQTGVQDLAFMWLLKPRILCCTLSTSVGLNAWHWYYGDNERYYRKVVQGTGAVPSAFHAWEANLTLEWIIPYSYMHPSGFFKTPNSLSFSGWVFGLSPGIVTYVPREKAFETDLFGTLSPYLGLQAVVVKHLLLGARLGYQFSRPFKTGFVDKVEQKWFASLLVGVAGK
jgi:hypothetical protein